jgi:hypothetical protein
MRGAGVGLNRTKENDMTDRKDALTKLLAKVEAGGVMNYQDTLPLVRGWRSPLEYFRITDDLEAAYNGSLDAAKALHKAVLPEWHWNVSKDGVARIVIPSRLRPIPTVGKSDATPARAWLIAILKALIAGGETNANNKGE